MMLSKPADKMTDEELSDTLSTLDKAIEASKILGTSHSLSGIAARRLRDDILAETSKRQKQKNAA